MNVEYRYFLNKRVTQYTFIIASVLTLAGSALDFYLSGNGSKLLILINLCTIGMVILLNLLLYLKLIHTKNALLFYIIAMMINFYSASVFFSHLNFNGTLSSFFFRESLLIVLFMAASSFLVSSYLTYGLVASYVIVYVIVSILFNDTILQSSLILINLVVIAYAILIDYLSRTISKLLNFLEKQNGRISESLVIIENQNNELTQKNQELEIQKELLEAANLTRDKFFSIISHDLKSPFNSILGLAEILKLKIENKNFEDSVRIANNLERSARNAYKLLLNLLDWARTQNGMIGYNPAWLNFNELLSNCINSLKSQAQTKEIELKTEIDPNSTIYADGFMLETILRNIISNAIKYSQKGSYVTISSTEDSIQTIISVKDKGTGMDEKQISGLFKLENRIISEGTEFESGTGLGLLICHEFIERHHGKIEVVSEPGKGSVFNLIFPKETVNKQ